MDILKDITITELLDDNFSDTLFSYSEDEVKDFHSGFKKSYLQTMYKTVAKAMKVNNRYTKLDTRYNTLAQFLRNLSSKDLKIFENMMEEFTQTSPNMLWNMLNKIDRVLYKTPERFHDWLSNLSEEKLDHYIYRASDNKPLHGPEMYDALTNDNTQVEILDGYIAISSSNLKALDKFRDRILFSNKCDYEHRIKKHEGITIHSYVFNMNKQNSN